VSGPADDARGFELTMGLVRSLAPVNGVVVATNHFQHPAMVELQTGWVVPSSENRLARLRELWNWRSRCGRGASGAGGSLPPLGASDVWDCLNNPGTIYSSIAEPASQTLWVRAHDRPDRSWCGWS